MLIDYLSSECITTNCSDVICDLDGNILFLRVSSLGAVCGREPDRLVNRYIGKRGSQISKDMAVCALGFTAYRKVTKYENPIPTLPPGV